MQINAGAYDYMGNHSIKYSPFLIQNWPFFKNLASRWGNCSRNLRSATENLPVAQEITNETETLFDIHCQSFGFIRNFDDLSLILCHAIPKIQEKLKCHGKFPEMLFQALHVCHLLSCYFWRRVPLLQGKISLYACCKWIELFRYFRVNYIETLNATLYQWFKTRLL